MHPLTRRCFKRASRSLMSRCPSSSRSFFRQPHLFCRQLSSSPPNKPPSSSGTPPNSARPSSTISSTHHMGHPYGRRSHRLTSTSTGTPQTDEILSSSRHLEAIRHAAMKRSHPATLEQIIEWSTPETILNLGQFVWEELPVRISHRVTELSSLPYGLSEMKSIRKLRSLYSSSFHLFQSHPRPLTLDSDEMISYEDMLERHVHTLGSATVLMANGIRERMLEVPEQASMIANCPFLNDFLDRFHASRIGTRLLTGQFVAAWRQFEREKSTGVHRDYVRGLIDDRCNPHEVLQSSVDAASRLCWDNYHLEPEVRIIYESPTTFKYVPSYLHYILFELFKNSMRATCEYHGEDANDIPIEVVISDGEHDITIKISDQGGGISREDMNKIWLYSFTSVPPEVTNEIYETTLADIERKGESISQVTPMAGMGYGLPLSRLHARYFGGDLQVISMHGYGTDVYVYLNKLENTLEPLNYAYHSQMSSIR